MRVYNGSNTGNYYKFLIQSDRGKFKRELYASSEDEAINQIMKYENCPRSSIIQIIQK